MSTRRALTAGVAALAATAGVAGESPNVSAVGALRPGAGRELVLAHCLPCHSSAIIAATRATRGRWDELITVMQQRHGLWPLPPAVRGPLLDYLASTQAPAGAAGAAGPDTPWAGPHTRPNPLW